MGVVRDLLTTQQKNYEPLWCSRAVVLPGYIEERTRVGPRWSVFNDLVWGWRLFRLSRNFRAVITGTERLAFVFAILQKCRRRRIPHIFMQSMWNLPESPVIRSMKCWLFRAIVSSADRVVVYSKRQLELYPKKLGIPARKLVFLHSHSCLYGEYSVTRGDYIFSGGDSNRDYRTLVEAVRGLPARVVIVTHEAAQLKRLDLPPNVELISGLPLAEFNRMIAGAAAVAIALNSGKMESGGRSVYGNAMGLGKPVVVADDDACDYITNGRDGLLVPAGDVVAFREALDRLLRDPALADTLGRNAKETAKAFEPAAFFQAIFALADECASGNESPSTSNTRAD